MDYLIPSPLYRTYNITVNRSFFDGQQQSNSDINLDDISEHIPIEESLIAQQQTLIWNKDEYLCLAPGQA